jgi:two-component system cell cycle sensor histidine kinase/response regulator CckA
MTTDPTAPGPGSPEGHADVELPNGTVQADPGETRAGQLALLSRHATLNAATTALAAVFAGIILWLDLRDLRVLAWPACHLALIAVVFQRQWRSRSRPMPRRISPRGLRHARNYGLVCGLLWGSGVAFLPVLSDPARFGMLIAIAGMATGAGATLAAYPPAAIAYAAGAFLPITGWFLWQQQALYLALAGLSVLMMAMMMASTSLVHRSIMDELRARRENRALLARFEEARRAWLDISESTEAFALFDDRDRPLLWNGRFLDVLSLPAGHPVAESTLEGLLREGSHPVDVLSGRMTVRSWIGRIRSDTDGAEAAVELDNGRWIQPASRRLPDGRLIVVLVDVTALKATEQVLRRREAELHQAQRLHAIGELAGGVAHDFNNILTSVLGNAELLRLDFGDRPEADELLGRITREANKAAVLTRQLLAFGRRQHLSPRRMDLNGCVDEVRDLLQSAVPESIEQHVSLDPELVPVEADPGQFERVLVNLVLNARDAMPQGGRLTIETASEYVEDQRNVHGRPIPAGPYARLSVIDTGRGMPRRVLEQAFDPFFSTKGESGAGLGLSSVYGIVTQSGGHLRVDSSPGTGTRFDVLLPAVSAREDAQAPRALRPDPAPPPEGTRLVLVEDDRGVLEIATRELEQRGYRVRPFSSPDEALAALRAEPDVDLIVTDVIMPGMSGPELVDAAREAGVTAPVLFVSGYAGDHADLARAPGVGFLQKPFAAAELSRAARALLPATAPDPRRPGRWPAALDSGP